MGLKKRKTKEKNLEINLWQKYDSFLGTKSVYF